MERCLKLNNEVLRNILQNLDKSSVLNVALTSKALLEPALDVLWYIQDSIVPIIQCLPDDVYTLRREALVEDEECTPSKPDAEGDSGEGEDGEGDGKIAYGTWDPVEDDIRSLPIDFYGPLYPEEPTADSSYKASDDGSPSEDDGPLHLNLVRTIRSQDWKRVSYYSARVRHLKLETNIRYTDEFTRILSFSLGNRPLFPQLLKLEMLILPLSLNILVIRVLLSPTIRHIDISVDECEHRLQDSDLIMFTCIGQTCPSLKTCYISSTSEAVPLENMCNLPEAEASFSDLIYSFDSLQSVSVPLLDHDMLAHLSRLPTLKHLGILHIPSGLTDSLQAETTVFPALATLSFNLNIAAKPFTLLFPTLSCFGRFSIQNIDLTFYTTDPHQAESESRIPWERIIQTIGESFKRDHLQRIRLVLDGPHSAQHIESQANTPIQCNVLMTLGGFELKEFTLLPGLSPAVIEQSRLELILALWLRSMETLVMPTMKVEKLGEQWSLLPAIAFAGPRLVDLDLGNQDYGISLLDLAYLVKACPHLRHISLLLDATETDLFSPAVVGLGIDQLHTTPITFDVHHSFVAEPFSVAAFLSGLFMNITEIRSSRIVSKAWEGVRRYLPHLTRIRIQEETRLQLIAQRKAMRESLDAMPDVSSSNDPAGEAQTSQR